MSLIQKNTAFLRACSDYSNMHLNQYHASGKTAANEIRRRPPLVLFRRHITILDTSLQQYKHHDIMLAGDGVTLLMLVGSVFFCVFMFLCMENMLAFKLNRKRSLFSIILIVLIALISNVASNVFQLSPDTDLFIVGLLITILLVFIYGSIPKGIMSAVYAAAFLFGVDSAVMLSLRLAGYEYGSILAPTLTLDTANILMFAVVFSVIWLLAALLERLLKKHADINILNNRVMHFLLISAGVALLFIYLNFAVEDTTVPFGRWAADFGDIAYVLFFVTSLIMFVIILRYVSKETAVRTEMLLAEASKKYIHDLEESYKTLRTIKHDYVNILTSCKLYIDNKDIEGLTKYYYDELSEINKDLHNQDKLIGSMQNIQISEIKSILIYKCSLAAKHGINTHIEITEPIESLGISTAIVCQMLGILLDNAIEAALETDSKSLNIAIVKNPASKAFFIKNSWIERDISLDKLFAPGFSTKGEGRGIGLSTVRNYTEKIKGIYLETELSGEYFTQILTVKDN